MGTILTDLSKAYNCLPHELSIAKLEEYGLDKPSLYLIMVTYVFGNKGKKLALRIVTGLMLIGVFPRDPS